MDRLVSAVRNTCFAILSSIECDLRDIVGYLCLDVGKYEILPSDVRSNATSRYLEDTKELGSPSPDTDLDLLPYTDFADLSKILYSLSKEFVERRGVDPAPLAIRLEAMAAARNRVCHSRPLHEEDLAKFLDLSNFALVDFKALDWKQLGEFQSKSSADPTFVLRLEIPDFWRKGDERIHHNVPLADYDDTSFLGRIVERKEITKYLLGHHPVITIVGEGGVGKTALAMQCVYDLMDLEDECPFEAMVWISLKTKTLTLRGIEDIRDSFVSVIGVMQDVAKHLGAILDPEQNLEGVMAEISEYMSQLKVLLVIDNFETLTTNPFRELLSNVPSGSKVLITSRVGLGELENRYPLDTLDVKTAVNLLRKSAKIANLSLLGEAPAQRLEKYCGLLFRNPLLIKWFVQGVAAGADPERLSARSAQPFQAALRYCFENLFERLTPEEKEILHLLAASRRQLTFTELMFLIRETSNTDQMRLEAAIRTLHSSSMIKRTPPDARSADVSTRINLTDVAVEYIAKFAPPEAKMLAKVQAALKKLREASEQSAVQTAVYKYELFAIRANSRDERICAIYLNQALQLLKNHRLDEARKAVEKVFDMLPSYTEAYRVASFIETRADDLYKASDQLDTALQYDPKSPLIYYQYAQLLLQKLEDATQALVKIDAALKLDPGDDALETLRALALTRLGRCADAAEIYERQLVGIGPRHRKWRITTRDQASECYRRWAEQDVKMKNKNCFIDHIDRACGILEEAIASQDFDERMGALFVNIVEDSLVFSVANNNEEYASKQLGRLLDARSAVTLPKFRRFCREYLEQAFGKMGPLGSILSKVTPSVVFADYHLHTGPVLDPSGSKQFRGTIKAIPLHAEFGFITNGEREWFFHRKSLVNLSEWQSLKLKDSVKFEEEMDNTGRFRAVKVIRMST